MKKILSVLIALMFVSFYPLSAMSYIASGDVDSLRCGTHLARVGDLKPQVFRECGKPASSTSGAQYGHDGTFPGVMEEWIYNLGPGDYLYTLLFEEGQLIEIRRGDRGF
jgi:hypothetical protein